MKRKKKEVRRVLSAEDRAVAAKRLREARNACLAAKGKGFSESRIARSQYEAARNFFGSGIPAILAKRRIEKASAARSAAINAKAATMQQANTHRLSPREDHVRHFGYPLPGNPWMSRKQIAERIHEDRA